MGLRWWWNLTLTGKLLVLGTLAGVAALAWALASRAGGPPAISPRAVDTSPSVAATVPPVTPTPMAPVPTPSPTATPARSPSPTAPIRVVESVRVLYTTCEGDGACGLMASGRRVHPGAAACNPALVPFGTRLRIRGWEQELTCEDVHPTLQGWYVVVWFASEAEGQAFRQRVGPSATVEVLYMPPRWGY